VAKPQRIAVVSAAAVTPIGQDLESFWSALVSGVSGISPIERFPVGDPRVGRGGEIKKIEREPRGLAATGCRASRVLAAAADELTGRAGGLPLHADPRRVAVVLGSALGGIEEGECALGGGGRPSRLAAGLYDSPARALARWLGAAGPALTVSTACASGATAIGLAADLLRCGAADIAVAGGYDVLSRFVMRGFEALRSLTRDAVRPFDRRRSGLLLGEGAGLVLLEREGDAAARGKGRLGFLLGHASTSDGIHISAPDPAGRGLEGAIRGAMRQAGVRAEEIEFVSAHGTGTPLNDRTEAAVLHRVLGRRAREVPVNSLKAHLGHTMGAAGALEAIMCLLAWRHGQVPHTLNLEQPDPECALDVVRGAARPCRPRISLSTSLGLGGCNAALLMEGA
jgi:3-oxoacyl-[acyl-carrier-protein] synthase II